jgi:Epoxide hydrolase N terminus
MMKAEPFEVQVSQTVLDDLTRRLAGTRWPDEIEGSGWEYGDKVSQISSRRSCLRVLVVFVPQR